MELNIIKQIKSLRQMLRHKPKDIVEVKAIKEKLKELRPVITRKEPTRKPIRVNIDGEEMTLPQVAKQYNLEISTVRARYRVGNRGKLLIRPSQMLFKPKKRT
jgi:hypothetical protein